MPTSLATVRSLVETDLTDTALQTLIDDADAAVEDRAPAGERTVHLAGGTKTLGLPTPSTVTSVTEGDTVLTVDTDFRVENGGLTIRRLNRRWGSDVEVTYTPSSNGATRTRVVVDLVKLAIAFDGYTTQTAGDWKGDSSDYQLRREQILTGLDRGRSLV